MTKRESDRYPEFSVLLSVYEKDNPHFLDQALQSVENQTAIPAEIILVVDGPISKELQAVIKRHQAQFAGFKVVKLTQNHGLGTSLRLGTDFVTTDWIARMDSDDISVPDRFEQQLKWLNEHPNVMLLGGQVSEFAQEPNNIIGHRRVPTDRKAIYQFAKWRSPFNHPTVMVNKDALKRVGGYVQYGNLEDYYLWARFIANGYDVANVDRTLVKMRVDTGMYNRRGRFSNIRYYRRLRKYLFQEQIVSRSEQMTGNFLMTLNIIIPNWLRELIYQRILHK